MIAEVLDVLWKAARRVQRDHEHVILAIVGDAGQQRPLGDELIAEVAPDDLDRRLDGREDLGQRVEVLLARPREKSRVS